MNTILKTLVITIKLYLHITDFKNLQENLNF